MGSEALEKIIARCNRHTVRASMHEAYALGRSEQREEDAKLLEAKADEYRNAFQSWQPQYGLYCYAASGCEKGADAIREAGE